MIKWNYLTCKYVLNKNQLGKIMLYRYVVILFLPFALLNCDIKTKEEKADTVQYNYTNHLINETSPYLIQHAHNPVNWYPWGEEALTKAREEDKPIFLSIGYAACHWCHVMEKESFENVEIAAFMNEHFINIKVDREERPDVDQLYMKFVQMFSGSGGWPMTVLLTPDQEPFFGGTYFPAEDRYGKPGLKKILKFASDFYENDKEKLHHNLTLIHDAFDKEVKVVENNIIPTKKDFIIAIEKLSSYFEPEYGGIGHAPKFPATQALYLFLLMYKDSGNDEFLEMVEYTLKNMSEGGIYDQVGGGFARYSTDEKWLVPHFEKMLYDNAQLASLYLDAYTLTKNANYLDIAESILRFVKRELLSPEGGFYSSLDADSDGGEGKYYVWDRREVEKILTKKEAAIFCEFYDITYSGNYEGKNILHIVEKKAVLAKKYNISEKQVYDILGKSKVKLFIEREKRVKPALDDKIITSWNALMLSAFAKAFQITRKVEYKKVILNNIQFIQKQLQKEGKLYHTYKAGESKYTAFIDDYAYLIQAYLDSYEALFDKSFIESAVKLTNDALDGFSDIEKGDFYYTSKKQTPLIKRLKAGGDQSIPSATGIMLMNLQRLSALFEDGRYMARVELIYKQFAEDMNTNPYGYGNFLRALHSYRNGMPEIVIVYKSGQDLTTYFDVIFKNFIPGKIVKLINEKEKERINPHVDSLKKMINNNITIYLCHDFTCSPPITKPNELFEELM